MQKIIELIIVWGIPFVIFSGLYWLLFEWLTRRQKKKVDAHFDARYNVIKKEVQAEVIKAIDNDPVICKCGYCGGISSINVVWKINVC